MQILKYIITVLPFFITFSVTGQERNLTEVISSIAEEMAADDSDPEAISLFIEQLYDLSINPVMINNSDESEISRLFFLNDFQIKTITNYVKTTGNILTAYEIAAIPGFDRPTAERMMPFINFRAINIKNDSITGRNNLLTSLIFKPGIKDTSSAGSQLRSLTKYSFKAGAISAGITAEKDQGEKLLSGSPPLPDFLSAYISYSGKGIIRRFIAGDYSARFGQGTGMNSGIRTGLSLSASGYIPGRDEIRPYTSADENNFFRGAAAEFSFKKMTLSLFLSQNMIDATIGTSQDSNTNFIKSLYTSGIHYTQLLQSKKDVLALTTYGLNIGLNFKTTKLGILWIENRFSLPFVKSAGNPENLYDFEGKKNQVLSLFYKHQFRRILLSGELSFNDAVNIAVVQGVNLRPSDRMTVNFLFRHYSPGFTTFTGKGPGTGTSTCNENGITGNFTFEAAKHLFISGGFDISSFPWLKYLTSFPSIGKREEIKLQYLPVENLTFDFSFSMRSSMQDINKEQGIAGIGSIRTRTFKGLIKYSFNENLTFVLRSDYKTADPSGSKGVLLSQDMIYRFVRLPVTLWFRYCIFSTADWASRLYIYENDLLQSFSIPALSGQGARTYMMINWDIGDRAEMRIKYGITSPVGGVTQGVDKDELKVQFRVWF
jgi:hypothetical protein